MTLGDKLSAGLVFNVLGDRRHVYGFIELLAGSAEIDVYCQCEECKKGYESICQKLTRQGGSCSVPYEQR
jgi:hypothetical protein